MRILVTGGAGFIGSALCRYLVGQCGCSVLNVDKLTSAASLQSLDAIANHSDYRFVQLDIANGKRMVELIEEFEPDAIVHLAAETHVDRSIDCAAPFIETNVTGTYVLLDVARRYWAKLAPARRHRFRFVAVSTDEVYGPLRLQDAAVTETDPYDPSSPYAASKAAGDHLARAWYRTYDLPVIISNCSNNFGPYQFPDKLIPLTILNALEGKTIGIYGRGENIRDWLYVDDHVRALLRIIQCGKPGEKYNISARNQRTNLELACKICDVVDELLGDRVGRRALIQLVADRPGHDLRYAIDPDKVERELGWSPKESFETALRETIGWYIANRSWWVPIRQNSYAGERLGRAEDSTGHKAGALQDRRLFRRLKSGGSRPSPWTGARRPSQKWTHSVGDLSIRTEASNDDFQFMGFSGRSGTQCPISHSAASPVRRAELERLWCESLS